jgi:thioredoxin-related protein
MIKKLLLLLLLFWVIPSGFAQLNLVAFEQIDSLQNIKKKKVVVFIHADWCQFCYVMKNTTFKNESIIRELNDNFYFIDFNGEEKRTIFFNKATFKFKATGTNSGIHELAIQLGTINKQLNYPSLCILNSENEIIFQDNNYIKPKEFLLILEKLKE